MALRILILISIKYVITRGLHDGDQCHSKHREIVSWSCLIRWALLIYRQVSNIRRTFVGNKIVDHSDVVIACRRCSNYIFILDLTPGFKGLGKDDFKTRWDSFQFWDLVRLILETLRYTALNDFMWLACPLLTGLFQCQRGNHMIDLFSMKYGYIQTHRSQTLRIEVYECVDDINPDYLSPPYLENTRP